MSVTSDVKNMKLTDKIAERFKPVHANSQNLTVESVKKHLPRGTSVKVTQDIVDELNNVERDCDIDQDLFEEQFLSYIHLAKTSGIRKLMNAIKFVALMQTPSMTQVNAYRIIFPTKAAERDAEGKSLDTYASIYAGSKMVSEVTKMQVLGFYITHAHLKNWTMNKMVNLANGIGASPDDRVSPTVQLNSLIAIQTAVTPPEDLGIELKIGMTDDAKESQQNLADSISKMAESQMERFKLGGSLSDVQKLNLQATPTIDVDAV